MTDAPNRPLWARLRPAIAPLGLSPKVFAADAEAGRIPVRVERFGPRGTLHVRADDLAAYIEKLNSKDAKK